MANTNNSYDCSYWQNMYHSYAMGNPWNGGYRMYPMQTFAYGTQFPYGNGQFAINQMFGYGKPQQGERLPQSTPEPNRGDTRGKQHTQNLPGTWTPAQNQFGRGKRFPQYIPASEPPAKRTRNQGKTVAQNSPAIESLPKEQNSTEDNTKRKNDSRFYRFRRNARRPAKEETTNDIQNETHKKCAPCKTIFDTAEEYSDHLKSDSHKVKSAEYHYTRKLPLGFDDDEEALLPAKIEDGQREKEETKRESEPREDSMEASNGEDKKEDEEDTKLNKDEKKPQWPKAVGVYAVMRVSGFYCKLCRMFFKSENVAKKKHCSSEMHYDAYKKAMEIALKEEEERQKIAELETAASSQEAEKPNLQVAFNNTEQSKEEVGAHNSLPGDLRKASGT